MAQRDDGAVGEAADDRLRLSDVILEFPGGADQGELVAAESEAEGVDALDSDVVRKLCAETVPGAGALCQALEQIDRSRQFGCLLRRRSAAYAR